MIDTLKQLGRKQEHINIYRDDDEWRGFLLRYKDDNGDYVGIDWQAVFDRIIIQIKSNPAGNVAATLTFDSADNDFNFLTETIDGTAYSILEVPITWEETRELPRDKYFYDIETHITYDTDKTFKWTPIYGELTIHRDVTRVEADNGNS
jgi:hypothetical protein